MTSTQPSAAAPPPAIASALRTLEAGHRLTLELSELFEDVVAPEGAWVEVTSSLPVEAFSLLCDEGTGAVTPRLRPSHPPRTV